MIIKEYTSVGIKRSLEERYGIQKMSGAGKLKANVY